MAIAAEHAMKVEVIGEEWLLTLIGPALIAVAAVVAASIAAYVSITNHRGQLAQDRELRNQEQARETLRGAAQTIAELLDPLGVYELTIRERDEIEKQAKETTTKSKEADKVISARRDENQEAVKGAREDIGLRLIKMTADTISLRIAFGKSSPIVERYRDLSISFNDRFRLHIPTAEGRAEREKRGTDKSAAKESLDAFQDACEEWAIEHPSKEVQGSSWRARR